MHHAYIYMLSVSVMCFPDCSRFLEMHRPAPWRRNSLTCCSSPPRSHVWWWLRSDEELLTNLRVNPSVHTFCKSVRFIEAFINNPLWSRCFSLTHRSPASPVTLSKPALIDRISVTVTGRSETLTFPWRWFIWQPSCLFLLTRVPNWSVLRGTSFYSVHILSEYICLISECWHQ